VAATRIAFTILAAVIVGFLAWRRGRGPLVWMAASAFIFIVANLILGDLWQRMMRSMDGDLRFYAARQALLSGAIIAGAYWGMLRPAKSTHFQSETASHEVRQRDSAPVRPATVGAVGYVFSVIGVLGFLVALMIAKSGRNSMPSQSVPLPTLIAWQIAGSIVCLASGIGILKGMSWGRFVISVWGAVSIVAALTARQHIGYSAITALVYWLLSLPLSTRGANDYFVAGNVAFERKPPNFDLFGKSTLHGGAPNTGATASPPRIAMAALLAILLTYAVLWSVALREDSQRRPTRSLIEEPR
jgi:hypothetical protein